MPVEDEGNLIFVEAAIPTRWSIVRLVNTGAVLRVRARGRRTWADTLELGDARWLAEIADCATLDIDELPAAVRHQIGGDGPYR